MSKNHHPDYGKRRGWVLFSVWVFFALHMVHWRYNETTLAPLELNEVLFTLHQGIVTAGFILMAVIMLATLIFGRFFCSWGCHILSLQDASYWILKKLKIRSNPVRSRTLIWVPMGAMLYLFVWPQIQMMIYGVETEALHVVENTDGQWSSFVTNDFWRNLPPLEIALSTFFIVGFLLIYLMGSRSFCFYGCPYGALFSLADQVAPGRIKLTGDCIQCGVCTVNCTSDILVHKEIKEFGMVTNPKCFKDLDCVASCPENALSFGFTKPPMFQSKFTLPDYGKRYSFTMGEDILMGIVFVISVVIFRGLYGEIPFLMSVGMSVATAYVALLTMRVFTKSSAGINGKWLKISNKITAPGFVFMAAMSVFFTFTIHSAVVQFHTIVGQQHYEDIGLEQNSEEAAQSALRHFETAYNIGLVKPNFLRAQMASIYLVQDRIPEAKEQLLAILEKDDENINALYRMAILEKKAGNAYEALSLFAAVTKAHAEKPEEHFMRSASYMELAKQAKVNGKEKAELDYLTLATNENTQNSQAWTALGQYYFKTGEAEKAASSLEKAVELEPESATIQNNLAAIYARSGQFEKAAIHFEKLVELQPGNPQGHYNLGMMKMKLGKTEEAKQSLQRALQLQPTYEKAIQGLAMLNQQTEKLEE